MSSQVAWLSLTLLAVVDEPARPAPDPIAIVTALETALERAVAAAEPSVVGIARIRNGPGGETTAVRKGKGGIVRKGKGADAPQAIPDDLQAFDFGAGVVVGDDGAILTAFHVVKGASQIVVRARGHKQFEAEVIAADPRSDLAVIAPKVEPGGKPPALRPIAIGDASTLRKGAFLLALGNSFNAMRVDQNPDRGPEHPRDGEASASWGILSNVARRIDPEAYQEVRGPVRPLRLYPTLLQLDTKLNLGMSGGAVVNLKGELVGITTTTGAVAGADAMAGYAIPMDALGRRVVATLREGKEVEYGFLGVGLSAEPSNRISDINPATPAGQAGLIEGDLIVAVGGRPVTDSDSLTLALSTLPVGQRVTLKIERDGRAIDKTIVLSKCPVPGEVIATNRPEPWRGLRVDYTSILPDGVSSDVILKALAAGGVRVVEVAPGSEADRAGLRAGQIVTAVDDTAVRSPAEFRAAVAGRRGPVRLATEDGPVVVK
ncbi:MAG TPA: trypsin-like peptidase domain-containing protein [Isosphaeraceae bacterium]|jgi:S1-C subfamily serine protease|nr:trypsin-like peptidase domain-containing protein [Isosphaeraceae bacterium]